MSDRKLILQLALAGVTGLGASCPGWAAHCVVISGANEDTLRVLKPQEAYSVRHKTLGFLGSGLPSTPWDKECEILDGWSQLPGYAATHPGPIGVVTASHGGGGGSTACNNGTYSAAEALKAMNTVAATTPIAVFVESCFSGDILQQKLRDDMASPNSPAISNLCLATSTFFGTLSYPQTNMFGMPAMKAKRGETAEEVFKRTDTGLISSAAWSAAKVDQFATARTVYRARAMLDALAGFNNRSCPLVNDDDAALRFYTAGKLSNDQRSTLQGFLRGNDPLRFHGDQVINWIKALDGMRGPGDLNRTNTQVCAQILGDELRKISKRHEKNPSEILLGEVGLAVTAAQANPAYRNRCPNTTGKTVGNFWAFSCPNGELKGMVKQYLTGRNAFERLVGRTPNPKVRDSDLVSQIIDSLHRGGGSTMKDDDVTALAQALLGVHTGNRLELDGTLKAGVTLPRALHHFVRASMQSKKFGNPLDAKRREACRKFVF